jgi:hypothetical protein
MQMANGNNQNCNLQFDIKNPLRLCGLRAFALKISAFALNKIIWRK